MVKDEACKAKASTDRYLITLRPIPCIWTIKTFDTIKQGGDVDGDADADGGGKMEISGAACPGRAKTTPERPRDEHHGC